MLKHLHQQNGLDVMIFQRSVCVMNLLLLWMRLAVEDIIPSSTNTVNKMFTTFQSFTRSHLLISGGIGQFSLPFNDGIAESTLKPSNLESFNL